MQKAVIVTLLVLAALFPAFMAAVAIHEGSAMARGIAGMVTGLIVLWIFGAGTLMWRLRDPIRTAVRRIPLNWRVKFVLFCILLACAEEAVTVTMTNLAPVFGARPARWYHAILAVPAIFLLALPLLLPIIFVITSVLKHPSIHF